jgi:hypothetical protein
MTSLLSTILNSLLSSLAKTTAKDSFISPLVPKEVERFVEGFNLDERREWEDGIRTCMESGDWSNLITHRMYATTLQDVFLTTATAARLQPVMTPHRAERAKRLHSMFGRQYQGNFHKLFVEALNDYEKIYNPGKHFGRIIPIIQSSGTGKSRMVREIGNDVRFLHIRVSFTFVL